MQIDDIKDERSLGAWLVEQNSREISLAVAARAALRVQPWLWVELAPVRYNAISTALPFVWSLFISAAAGARQTTTVEVRESAVASARAAARSGKSVMEAAAASSINAKSYRAAARRIAPSTDATITRERNRAAKTSAAQSRAVERAAAAVRAAAAANSVVNSSSVAAADAARAASSGATIHAKLSVRLGLWEEITNDLRMLSVGNATTQDLPLWQSPPEQLSQDWDLTRANWQAAREPWSVFAGIFQDIWDGSEIDWDYLTRVALIDPELWEVGPEQVAEALVAIKATVVSDNQPTALSLASVTDFFCDGVLRQMRLAGFDDDLAHLRNPDRVQRFMDDVEEARDGLQDFFDYASDTRGQTNAPVVLATAAEKMLAELKRAEDRDHVRARRIIILGKQLRGLSSEETKRKEIGEALANILDDSVDLLADVCRRHLGPSIEVLSALDGLNLADTSPADLITRFSDVLDRIDRADGHTLVPLSTDAAALLREMLEEMKDTEASLAEAGSETFIARLRERLASQAGALGATIGRYYEKGAPHADAAGKSADQAIKNYKRWKSLQDILAWLGDVFGGG